MGKINVLPFEVANMIAAGEVVERPSSVVKELLENAIDAGGRYITVEIQGGGVRLIRVTDDGCGMSPEDMPVALRRHATSKIKDAGDLEGIMTLGFRGEALAAIAAVSKITILSKTTDASTGTILQASAGQITDVSSVGCADGTTVSVEDLFYNVPARRKFLKKDVTEAMAVTAVCEKVAMSRPDIAFRLVIDGSVKFETIGDGSLYHALYALCGADFAKKLLAVDGKVNGIEVGGYVGRSDNSRNNRNYQNVFLNGRFVKSKTVMAALEQAYTSYMAPERFPVCALFLHVDPKAVDVNVHPAKLEVKFSDERAVFEAVYYSVRSTLENASFRPELSLDTRTKKEERGRELLHSFPKNETSVTRDQIAIGFDGDGAATVKKSETPIPAYLRPSANESVKAEAPRMTPQDSLETLSHYKRAADGAIAVHADPFLPTAENGREPADGNNTADIAESERCAAAHTAEKLPVTTTTEEAIASDRTESGKVPLDDKEGDLPPYTFIGEAFRCYLLVETGEGLLLIDKHAAHERVLFEELKKEAENDGRIASQGLLLPLPVMLTCEEQAAADTYRSELLAVGFAFENDKNGDILLTAIPSAVSTDGAGDLFTKMCDELDAGTGNPAVTAAIRREKSLYQIACKGAVKGGRIYDAATLRWLIEKILRMPDITVCPHGRPIAIRLTKTELDRRFDRIK